MCSSSAASCAYVNRVAAVHLIERCSADFSSVTACVLHYILCATRLILTKRIP
jgi:hypothetical protein